MKCYAPFFFLLLFLHPAGWMHQLHAQSDLRLSIPGRIEAGLNFASVDKDANSDWFQAPGTVFTLSSGIAARYRERLTANLEIGFLFDSYNFVSSYAEYSITHFVPETRLNLSYLFPFKNDPTKAIAIGGEAGYSFTGDEVKSRTETLYRASTNSYGPTTFFFSPEIGIARRWPAGQMRLMLTYLHYQRNDHIIKVQITENNGANFTALSRASYIGLRLMANFDVRGHKALKQTYTPPPALSVDNDFRERNTRMRKELDVRGKRLILKLWDNADIDGDTISVKVNGRYVLTAHALTKKKKRVKIVLDPGENVIVVHAHNEGRVPPNTAAALIRNRFKREKLIFSTGLSRNESIIINY